MNDPLYRDLEFDTNAASAEPDSSHAVRLADFNCELNQRLAALDQGQYIDPALTRARLAAKSAERRNLA